MKVRDGENEVRKTLLAKHIIYKGKKVCIEIRANR